MPTFFSNAINEWLGKITPEYRQGLVDGREEVDAFAEQLISLIRQEVKKWKISRGLCTATATTPPTQNNETN
jgi:hypothetical protein